MKKQKIQLFVMLVLILLCVLGYVLLNRYSEKKQEEELAEATAASEVVFQINADDIKAFSYQVDGATYSYVKDDDQWVCEGYESIDLSETQITALLTNVTVIECDEVLTDIDDYSQYGFDEPSNVITLVTDDETITITIGDYNSTAYCYYYMTSLSEAVYAGGATVCTSFIETPDYYQEIESETAVSANETN